MLNIDCLLHNTDLVNDLRNLVEMVSYERASNSRKVGISEVYNDIRKSGVEVDMETVGYLYNEMSRRDNDQRFTHPEEVQRIVGKNFDKAIRDIILNEGEHGNEKQIGELPPAKAITKGLMQVMDENNHGSEENKSIMRTIQDAAYRGMKRILGEQPDTKEKPTPEKWEDILKRTMETEQKGYTQVDGTLNNIRKVFDQTKKEISNITDKLRAEGKYDEAEKYSNAMKSVQDATYSLLFSTREGKDVLYGILKDAGYAKELQNGKTVIDWEKLATHANDVADLRDNAMEMLKKGGYEQDAPRIADALTKDFHEIIGRVREKQASEETRYLEHIQRQDEAIRAKKTKAYQNLLKKSEKARIQTIKELLKENGYGKEDKDGNITIDWAKMAGADNSPEALKQRIADILEKTGYSAEEANDISEALKEGYDPLKKEITTRAWNKLQGLVKSIEAERPGQRSAFARMAELNNLGLFQREHEAVLHSLIGTDDIDVETISKMRDIAMKISDFEKAADEKGYDERYTAYVTRQLTSEMETLVGKARNNKTMYTKIVGGLEKAIDIMNVGRLMGHLTIAENVSSNMTAMIETVLLNPAISSEDRVKGMKLFWSTFKDVGKGGISYGDIPNKLMASEGTLEQMKWDNNDHSAKGIANKLGYVTYALARYGLNAADSSFKSMKTNMLFRHMIYKAMIAKGWSKEQALKDMGEALHGQSYEQAQKDAKELLERMGMEASKDTIRRFADDLVKKNLENGGMLDPDIIEGAMRGSFRVAGMGIGHEVKSLNVLNEALKEGRKKRMQRQVQLDRSGNINAAATYRLTNALIYKVMMPFAVGGANWAYLGLQKLGLGLVTGGIKKYRGEYKGKLDFTDAQHMQKSFEEMFEAREDIKRAFTGMALTAIAMGGLALYATTNNKEYSDELADIMNTHPLMKRWATKLLPSVLAVQLYASAEHDPDNAVRYGKAIIKAMGNNLNIGNSRSFVGHITQISDDLLFKRKDLAAGEIGQMLGEKFELPAYKAYKGYYKLFTGQENMYKQNMSIVDGLWGNGLLEDVGIVKDDAPITAVPGFRGKLGESLSHHGINTIQDLKRNKKYLNAISNKETRQRAEKMIDAY